MKKIEAFGNYSIIVDCEISHLKNWLTQQQYSAYFVLFDENTKEHCLPKLSNALPDFQLIEIQSGEQNKNIETFEIISEALLLANADRKALLINLGGGVIGDMGGFVAGCYKRGIDFIQIPTTLLAMVDASIGGKTGINFKGVKNQIGLFANPKFVWANPEFLATLPNRHLTNGIAEILKHNILSGKHLKENYIANLMKDGDGLIELVANAVRFKNEIVSSDYKEGGARKQLNFGHTFGHALESYSLKNDNEPLIHGEAIAGGMLFELLLCAELNYTSKETVAVLEKMILQYFEAYKLSNIAFHTLVDYMKKDKKNNQQEIQFALIKEPGEPCWDIPVDMALLEKTASFYIEKYG